MAFCFDIDKNRDVYETIPEGSYTAMVTSAVATTEEKGKYTGSLCVKLTVEVIEGEYRGRKLWDTCYYECAEKVGTSGITKGKIDAARLASYFDAVKFAGKAESVEPLKNIPIDIEVVVSNSRNYIQKAAVHEAKPTATGNAPWHRN